MSEPFLPKSAWGPGPWQDEPDSYTWTHAGLTCHLYRSPHIGTLNGYVALDPQHPWWGKDHNECVSTPTCEPDPPIDFDAMARQGWPVAAAGSRLRERMNEPRWSCAHRIESLLEVHGGVTYAGPMTAIVDNDTEIFHWGLGFDTGHAGDATPALDALTRQMYLGQPDGQAEWAEYKQTMESGPFGNTYKGFAYVKAETERLAEQLAIAKDRGWQALSEEGDDGENQQRGPSAHRAVARRM
jgi:hypothetical protein